MPNQDRDKQLALQRAHYARNKERVKEKSRRAKRTKRDEWFEYKKTLKCVKCGFDHPATLDFHHVFYHESNNKLNELIRRNAWSMVWEELKKCVVLCSNCHRIHHHDERIGQKRQRKAKKAVQSTHTHQATPAGQRKSDGNEDDKPVQRQRIQKGREGRKEDESQSVRQG